MATANTEINYRGIFTYEYGGVLKTIRIVHAIKNGEERERLLHTSGEESEVIRRGLSLECHRVGDSLLFGTVPGITSLKQGYLEDFYELRINGKDRIASRAATLLNIVPKDEFRYGFVLGIDDETGLLLQALLIGNNKRVLERFQFVDIQTGVEVSETELQPTVDNHLVVAESDTVPCVGNDPKSGETRRWHAAWLPPGFMLAGYQPSDDKNSQEVLLYTDGLSIFSVFIDSGDHVDLPQIQGQRGATVAYLATIGTENRHYTATVVGEIPVATAKRVVFSLAPLQ